ncbi:AhpA/YtjB family protein [Alteromonas aestuariivivens]|nr:AhpA/YtjB family protein [Alteromonas aestuariivivens]
MTQAPGISSAEASADERRNLISATHSGYRAVKRIFHTVVLILTSVLMAYALLMYQQQQSNWLEFESKQTGQILASQYSRIIAPSVANSDLPALNNLLAILTREASVKEATVYDSQGIVLAPAENTVSMVSEAYLSTKPPVTHVADIKNSSDQVIGYLRILIDSSVVLDPPIHYEQLRTRITAVAALIAFILGVYLTRGFYKMRHTLSFKANRVSARTFYRKTLNKRQ